MTTLADEIDVSRATTDYENTILYNTDGAPADRDAGNQDLWHVRSIGEGGGA